MGKGLRTSTIVPEFSDLMKKLHHSLIFVCSPYRGDVETNVRQAERYCRIIFEQQAVPIAPHLLFPRFLNDDDPDERRAGLFMGIEVLNGCDELWAFGEPTEEMAVEIAAAVALGVPVQRFSPDCREVGVDA